MAFSVSFVTRYIKSLLENDYSLKNIEVEGEISNITYQNSGIAYFTIKDEKAVLSGIMFKDKVAELSIRPKTGDKVCIEGYISVYQPQGKYQIIARNIKLSGEGDLYKRFIELKEDLEERGMFDEQYKRPLPRFIKTLGVVTSPTGAAVWDIINITKSRNPYVSIVLYPALVQGEGSAESIAQGIQTLDNQKVDVMIVGRGGGSMEDLWSFNEETVANAIFASDTPIISAVGHETDTSISDYVADMRAPTPTAAAQMAVFDAFKLRSELVQTEMRVSGIIKKTIDQNKQRALLLGRNIRSQSPGRQVKEKREKLLNINRQLESLIQAKANNKTEELARCAAALSALSPANRLSQGYSYVTKDGKNIYRYSDVKPGDKLNIRVCDGQVNAEVTEVVPDGKKE